MAVLARWNTRVGCPENNCGGKIEAVLLDKYLSDRYVSYAYKCARCGIKGSWKSLAYRLGYGN